MHAPIQSVIRFEDFELDAHNYRLRRLGEDLKLERLPLELLVLLASRPGVLVTRDEIVEKLWGSGIHLDTENAINTAIRKIRVVLGDAPAAPRFVQTITGKGYRFIARTEPSYPSIATAAPAPEAEPAVPGHRLIPTRWAVLLGGAALLIALVAAAFVGSDRGSLQVSDYAQITNDGQPKIGPILCDGLRLYFAEGSQNQRALMQAGMSGGETTPLADSLDTPRLMDIAPNRSDLLMSLGEASQSALWLMSIPEKRVRRIGDLRAEDATWSPDGREIIYVKGTDVYRVLSDGTGGTKIASFSGVPSWPRWSPDGSRIRLTITDQITGSSSLWEVPLTTGAPHPLLPGWSQQSSECCGSWTPDGRYFLFQAARDGKTEVYCMPDSRSWFSFSRSPVRLTSGQIHSLAPRVSPTGNKLFVIGQQLRGELVHYDKRSGEFVPYLHGISAEFVDFSKDGNWVTYVSFPDRTLWRSRMDGSERLQLTTPPVQATMPRWSPDGKRIAYFDAAPGKPWRIDLISADGGKPEPLLEERRNQMDPNWSPDGRAILFSYFPLFERVSRERLGIYVVDVQTRSVKKLPGSDGLWVPRWSPDGTHVVARSADSQSLMLFRFETETWSELARGGYVVPTYWSDDGRFVYYMRRGVQPALLRVNIANGQTEHVVSLKNLRQTGFRGAVWSGLTPDASPLFLRDIGTEEIYALDLQTR